MALVAFLRGVNVGGRRTFRPSVLARQMSAHDVVNLGAAGTFVIRRPGSRAKLCSELLRNVPFEAKLILCDGRDLLRLEAENPFGRKPCAPGTVRFVSILPKPGTVQVSLPLKFPPAGEWSVRVEAVDGQFVFGTYRRHMKAIAQLGQLDKFFGMSATTRNWNTILAVLQVLKAPATKESAK